MRVREKEPIHKEVGGTAVSQVRPFNIPQTPRANLSQEDKKVLEKLEKDFHAAAAESLNPVESIEAIAKDLSINEQGEKPKLASDAVADFFESKGGSEASREIN